MLEDGSIRTERALSRSLIGSQSGIMRLNVLSWKLSEPHAGRRATASEPLSEIFFWLSGRVASMLSVLCYTCMCAVGI